MEEYHKRHITAHLWELVKLTCCNTTCMSILIQNGVLSDGDVAELKSIPNEMRKTEKLYELLLTKKGSYTHLKTALEEDCQTGALEILSKFRETEKDTTLGTFGATPKDKVPIRFDVIPPVLNFTGREPQLCDIHEKLQGTEGKRAVISQMASVVGLGGIGKTELARKYVQKYGEQFYNGNVVWISSENEMTLVESFKRLASDHLNLTMNNVDKKDYNILSLVDQIYTFFNGQNRLFVFDNAESTEHLGNFMPFRLPPSTSLPYILITSRDREWSFSVDVLELDEMTEQDAIRFVKTSLQMQNDDDDYDEELKLVNRLQRYPLALSQAVSFIKQRQLLGSFSIGEYLDKFEANCEKLLDSKVPPAGFNSYRETTLTTWRVTTEQITSDEEKGRCAMEILNCISFLQPDQIRMSIFQRLSKGEDILSAVHLLVKYSMVNVQREAKAISVHRLVQQVTRIQLQKNKEEEQALKTTLQLVDLRFRSDIIDEGSAYQALSAYKFSCALNSELSIKFKHLPWGIVYVLSQFSRFEEAKKVGKELEQLLAKIVPPDDADLIRLEHHVPLETEEWNLEKLENLHQKFVENKHNSFSESELLGVETLVVRGLEIRGRYQEAWQLARKILERQIALYGINDFTTLGTFVQVATCNWKLGSSAPPIGMSKEEFKLFQRSNKRELNDAVSVMKEAYQSNRELVGKNYYWTVTMYMVADLLTNIGDTDFATEILRIVIHHTRHVSENRFAEIFIRSIQLLTRIKLTEENYEEALACYQTWHFKLVDMKGKKDWKTLEAQEMVAKMLLCMNQLEAALGIYTHILNILKEEGKLPHPDNPLQIHVNLVEILGEMKWSEGNLRLLATMKSKMETEFGECHPLLETVENQINLINRDKSESVTQSRKNYLVLISFIIFGFAILINIFFVSFFEVKAY